MTHPILRRFARTTSFIARNAQARTAYTTVVLLALASASISTMAQSFVDTDPALYRCAVLGDTAACRQPVSRPGVWYEEWVELGTHAKYMRYLGADAQDAIAAGRLRGEEPVRHVVQVSRIALSPEQAYARAMSQRLVPDTREETLSVAPALEDRPLLHNDWSASLLALPARCPAGSPPKDQGGPPAAGRCRDFAGPAK